MDYRLDMMDEDSFENLTNTICQQILGTGTVSFAPGKDGGKDGKFIGTANNFPSETEPWKGTFIIQAKHTGIPTASCSDNEFVNQIRNKEIPKLKKMKSNSEIDNYIIFTNRKYTGVNGDKLCEEIKNETGIQNVVLIGKETINDQYLNNNREIVKTYSLDKHHIPFDFSDEEIRDIIVEFKKQLGSIEDSLKTKTEQVKYSFDRIKTEEKNEKNSLGKEYFEDVIISDSLSDFSKIRYFLNDPINSEFKDYFYDTASELNEIITIKRDNFSAFEELFYFIRQKVCDGSVILKGSKRHVSTLLHFMYAECLIGRK